MNDYNVRKRIKTIKPKRKQHVRYLSGELLEKLNWTVFRNFRWLRSSSAKWFHWSENGLMDRLSSYQTYFNHRRSSFTYQLWNTAAESHVDCFNRSSPIVCSARVVTSLFRTLQSFLFT